MEKEKAIGICMLVSLEHFRNPSAHRLVDPAPHEGGAYIVFVNLLLKMLDDLR